MSTKSDQYERDVAEYINSIDKVKAERPQVGTDYSDVKMTYNKKTAWLEVKMNHTDNLGNPRVFYEDGSWQTTYDTPIAKEACKQLNESVEATKFVKDLAKFTKIPFKSIKIPTTKGGLKDKFAVSKEKLKEFCEKRPNKQYIMKKDNVNVSNLVEKHYTEGKTEPAYYLQTGDDFYKITNKNPFGFKNSIPRIKGTGTFNVRASIRSEFYEIQLELKLTDITSKSDYSLMPGTNKKNPFYE